MKPVSHVVAGLSALVVAGGLAGCAVAPPSGPTVVSMPGPGVSFDQFRHDDQACRYYASRTIRPGEAQAAGQSATNTAVGGTLLGAAAGALLGAAGGNAGAGAAIGAGSGLLVGSSMAGGTAQGAANSMQARYNVAYAQCMVGHGNKMEGYAGASGPAYNYGAPPYAPPGYYAYPRY